MSAVILSFFHTAKAKCEEAYKIHCMAGIYNVDFILEELNALQTKCLRTHHSLEQHAKDLEFMYFTLSTNKNHKYIIQWCVASINYSTTLIEITQFLNRRRHYTVIEDNSDTFYDIEGLKEFLIEKAEFVLTNVINDLNSIIILD